MRPTGNPEQIKRLVRILKNLHDFELVICGYQSLSIFRDVLSLVHQISLAEDIKVIDINVSDCKESHDFQKNLSRYIEKNSNYVVFNVLGMEDQVKDGEQSRFLNNLNLQRELLASRFPYSFIFWLPENLIKRFAIDAPDLWAWRNSVLVLEDKRLKPKGAVMESYEHNVFSNFTINEKKRQIDYLLNLKKRVLREYKSYKQQKKLSTILSDLADIFYLTSDYDKALKHYLDSAKISKKLGNQQDMANSFNEIGLIYRKQGDYDKALKYFVDSVKITEKLGDQLRLVYLFNNIGSIYQARGDYDKALKYYLYSVNIIEKLGDQQGYATTFNNIGLTYYALGDYNNARKYFLYSINIIEKLNDYRGLATSFNNLGLIYQARGDYDKALKYFFDSVKITENLGDQEGLATTFNNIGIIYNALDDYDKSFNYFNKSKSIANKIGAKDLLDQIISNIRDVESKTKVSIHK